MVRIPQWVTDRSPDRSVSAIMVTAVSGQLTSKCGTVVPTVCITLMVYLVVMLATAVPTRYILKV